MKPELKKRGSNKKEKKKCNLNDEIAKTKIGLILKRVFGESSFTSEGI